MSENQLQWMVCINDFLSKNKHRTIRFFIFWAFFNQLVLCPNLEIQAFFSPGGNITGQLLKRIAEAKKSILAAVYTFTDATIAQALVDARNRGVEVTMILDRASLESPWGKSKLLINAGVAVFCKLQWQTHPLGKQFAINERSSSFDLSCDQALVQRGFSFAPIMHHKYAVFDRSIVWTGSFNWTISANSKNNENVLIITNAPDLAAQFAQNFQTVLGSCTKVDLAMVDAIIQRSKDQRQLLVDKKAIAASNNKLFDQTRKLSMKKVGKNKHCKHKQKHKQRQSWAIFA